MPGSPASGLILAAMYVKTERLLFAKTRSKAVRWRYERCVSTKDRCRLSAVLIGAVGKDPGWIQRRISIKLDNPVRWLHCTDQQVDAWTGDTKITLFFIVPPSGECATSGVTPELAHRIEAVLLSKLQFLHATSFTFGNRTPTEIPGFDRIEVPWNSTVGGGNGTFPLLISKDGWESLSSRHTTLAPIRRRNFELPTGLHASVLRTPQCSSLASTIWNVHFAHA